MNVLHSLYHLFLRVYEESCARSPKMACATCHVTVIQGRGHRRAQLQRSRNDLQRSSQDSGAQARSRPPYPTCMRRNFSIEELCRRWFRRWGCYGWRSIWRRYWRSDWSRSFSRCLISSWRYCSPFCTLWWLWGSGRRGTDSLPLCLWAGLKMWKTLTDHPEYQWTSRYIVPLLMLKGKSQSKLCYDRDENYKQEP